MDPEVADEARELVRAARAALVEFHDEGIESYERLSAEEIAERMPVAAASEPAAEAPPPRLERRREAPPAEPKAPAKPAAPAPPVVPEPAPPPETVPWGEQPSLDEVRAHLGDCTRCALHAGRTQLVFGDGNPNADLMFIGEGPGEQEDKSGLPFVGRAGELLTSMIEKGLGIERRNVYICNIVKCRPPGNRTPLPDEVSRCSPFLAGQIAAVRPKVIVALGKPATSLLLGRDVAITRLRGNWQSYQGIPLMPTLHPAFVLRQYTEQNRRAVWEDLKAAHAKSLEG